MEEGKRKREDWKQKKKGRGVKKEEKSSHMVLYYVAF
jgi:hypothetical protein